jgi:hypothetical protein
MNNLPIFYNRGVMLERERIKAQTSSHLLQQSIGNDQLSIIVGCEIVP